MSDLSSVFKSPFRRLEERVATERGAFTLFALLERPDLPGMWELVVAAPWFGSDNRKALDYLVEQIRKDIGNAALVALSRIVILPVSDPRVEGVTRAFQVEHGDIEVRDTRLFGFDVRNGVIITARPMPRAA